ncbi:hypothetical protein WJX75_004057 [Coccomyxa subellipsoidea]|uniref:Coatomer subunit gamma n=1 Tax=Coccomyxa subellipsoidea TaxID=248742 RepID=A0ABR2YKT4_9CHLO
MAATAQDPSAPLRGPEKKDEDRDEDTEYSPFYAIEKGAVLQEARCFNDPHIDPRRCQQVITKLLYLLTQGETLTKKEASEVFFSVTKLYQNSQLLGQIERYLKQAIVDKAAVVASAVLVSALHLLGHNAEIVKRWTNEIQEAVHSKHSMVQFHGVALLHALRANDRLAVSKLVTSLTKSNVRSSLAQCLLVRYVAQVIAESTATGSGQRPFYDFLESCLRHKAELVIFEAARAIVAMPEVTARELAPAITVLQLFLTSSKPVLRFASVRTLNKVAMTHPGAVAATNLDLEALISDSNRTIATLAITTLLKTGNESSVERLLKQIGSFMSDIADDFKIVVVEAIRSLCLKFPQKYRALMNFLSNVLREDGGFEYKKAIVDSILILIKDIPDAKEPGLGHLCEFIEDCEFTYLSTQILHLLGVEGPKTKEPAKYIRFIYNRIILENATVRAAAVSSLAKFGALVEDLRPRIRVLLSRALHDNDDEVRDRATLYLAELDGHAGGPQAIDVQWNIPPKNLEKSLRAYLENGTDAPFDLASVPKAVPQAPQKDQKKKSGPAAASKPEPVRASQYVDALRDIPELAHVGPLFKSAEPLLLTEEETEYNIAVVVHVFEAHVLLQFNCTNTVQEQVLENVSVAVDLSEAEEFEAELSLPLARMEYGSVGQTYVLLQRAPDSLAMGKLGANLQFTVKEIDPSSGEAEEDGYEDEYQLEDIEIGAANYIKAVPVSNFRKAWEDTDPASEISDDYGLGMRDSLQDAVEAVMAILSMASCDGSDAVPPNARSHTLLLAGQFVGDVPALARISFGIDIGRNVAMKLVSRSDQHEISDFLHQIIQS